MSRTIAEIAEALGAEAHGDTAIAVTGLAEPHSASRDCLALAMSPRYAEGLARGAARAAVIGQGMDWRALGLEAAITVPRPRLAMAGLTSALDEGPEIAPGIHPTAVIADSARIGEGAAIGPFVVVGAGARIGANARIGPHVSIGDGAEIGADALFHPGVRIGARVRIGRGVIIGANSAIGNDGFSFVTETPSTVEITRESLGSETLEVTDQRWLRIHSLGSVVLGDEVEIGAMSTIDRGTVADTTVGDRTKIDNMVHVGHNCRVGADCLLCGQVGIAGSVVIGDRVVLGGQTGVADNLTVGENVVTGAGTVILSTVPPGRMLLGYPATRMDAQVAQYKALRRLPRLAQTIADLKKAVFKTDRTP